ncbi:Patellin-2 [Raphanus sativus]|uniref:Patellin-2 n=1 Tax=Raphanus sativus TaxID=3726 RepID=A0A6J0JD63_RAPSA|nr:patellin-2 [Raphanus sativus]KAJ4916412.1 Patellin-2 [Raphanus sativus]
MAQEEIQKPAASTTTAPVPAKEETPVVPPVKEVSAPVTTEKSVTAPAPESKEEQVVSEKEAPVTVTEPEVTVEELEVTAEKVEEIVTGQVIAHAESFKEEGYLASELTEAEKNALAEFKEMVREALNKHEFTAPPPPPVKEETVEETKTEETEEVKTEETEEKSAVVETKPEEKSAAPTAAETKTEEKSAVTAPEETKPAAPAPAEIKKEEKAVAPTPVETKPAAPVVAETKKEETPAQVETKPAAPVVTETKKEETPAPVETKPAAPVTTETKKEEKPVPVETKPAAPVVTETKKEEKPAPVETKPAAPVTTVTKQEEKPVPVETKAAAPVTTETKQEEKPAPVETKPAAPVTTEIKKEEEREELVTIEKAFAAEVEEATKTVEAIEESIVSITLPETAATVEPEEVSIWGIPLLQDERSDVILLKFLRARDFKVKEAFTMLKNTVQWRKENNIDDLVEEDLQGVEFEKMVFTHGVDKQGHVVIYSSYGEFQNKEIFSDKEKFNKFLKWRIQFQEKCVRSLDFSPEAKSSFVFVSDFRNAPGLGKRSLWQFIRRAVKQFEDNYPEFVAKELFINVPWWYIPYYKTFGNIIISPRTRSKMVLAGPSKSAETIFKYVAPEVVPVKYGGLSKESPFAVEDGVTEAVVKSSAKHTIELPASEGSTLSWELRVLGADVSYGAQFEPTSESSYTVIVSKNRKIGLTDEPVITDSFKAGEPGKIIITIDNNTFKKKKVIYRFKTQA